MSFSCGPQMKAFAEGKEKKQVEKQRLGVSRKQNPEPKFSDEVSPESGFLLVHCFALTTKARDPVPNKPVWFQRQSSGQFEGHWSDSHYFLAFLNVLWVIDNLEEFNSQAAEPQTNGEYIYGRKFPTKRTLFTLCVSSEFYSSAGDPDKGYVARDG